VKISSWPRAQIALFCITLAFRTATALPLQHAGYMDASYAIHVAENLARGRGFIDEVLWNFLDNPAGLPHPSNLYWMPLQSVLIAPFFFFLGTSYRVAQIPFILLSSLVPLISFHLARRIFARDDYAWTAAIFTAFSGFYTIYWVSPDSFTPFALFGAMGLYFIGRGAEAKSPSYFVLAGILAGLSHLSRADGALLLAIPPLVLLLQKPFHLNSVLRFTILVFVGYLLCMTPWFMRNYFAIGSPYPSAGTKTLWLLNYDELFRYTDDLTPTRYFASGLGSIVGAKLVAAARNLFVVAFGDLQVFLVPFAVVGWWQLRKHIYFLPFSIYSILLYLAMTFAFTYPSWRGSVLHSSTALLPFFAVAIPKGIEATVGWVARRRGSWNNAQAARFFQIGFAVLAIVLSVYLYEEGVFAWFTRRTSEIPLWNQRDAEYPDIANWLNQNAHVEDVVMTVDPPSFYNVSHRRAIMIPTDPDTGAIFRAARQFHARYLILEPDHPASLNGLFAGRAELSGLDRVADFHDALGHRVTLFEVVP
jgi:hypothetical protein